MSQREFIKPKMVNVNGVPRLATIPYREGGVLRVLPPEGAKVSMVGAAGSFWRRRISEGGCEIVAEQKTAAKTAKKGEG